jgi:hypothetical protein
MKSAPPGLGGGPSRSERQRQRVPRPAAAAGFGVSARVFRSGTAAGTLRIFRRRRAEELTAIHRRSILNKIEWAF